MAHRGVRFIQLFHRGWDQHISIKNQLPKQCRDIDQASAALIKDLKRLGTLEDTLVICRGKDLYFVVTDESGTGYQFDVESFRFDDSLLHVQNLILSFL